MSLRPRSTLLLIQDVHLSIQSKYSWSRIAIRDCKIDRKIWTVLIFIFAYLLLKYNKIKVLGVNCYKNEQYK